MRCKACRLTADARDESALLKPWQLAKHTRKFIPVSVRQLRVDQRHVRREAPSYCKSLARRKGYANRVADALEKQTKACSRHDMLIYNQHPTSIALFTKT